MLTICFQRHAGQAVKITLRAPLQTFALALKDIKEICVKYVRLIDL